MKEYIDKSALVAEIERLKKIQLSTFSKGETQESCYDSLTCISVYNEILSFLDTLEVKEVDLEKEIKKEYLKRRHYNSKDNMLVILNELQFNTIAKYFFELGLKAQKG